MLKDEDLKSTAPLEVKLVPAGRRSQDGSSTTMACRGRGSRSMSGCPTRTGPQDWASAVASARRSPPTPRVASGSRRSCQASRLRSRSQSRTAGGVQLDAGNALRKPTLKPGEICDLGDVKAKEKHQQ